MSKSKMLTISIFALFFLVAGLLGYSWWQKKNTKCPLPPMEYLIRSNCPFQSTRIDGECRVVCPMSFDTTKSCKSDNECDCSRYRTKEKTDCRCSNKKCYAVVDKAEVSNWP